MSLAGGYDFSQLYHASVVSFSPGSTFIATIHNRRLVIRSTSTLSIVRTFQCLGGAAGTSKQSIDNVAFDQLLWSPDSLYLLAFSAKAATAWIFGLTQEGHGEGGEVAQIGGAGVDGLVRVEWGKADREVLAWSDYGLKLTIWDLTTGKARYIQQPKSTTAHSYSADSRYLAVAEKHQSKDFIGIYDTQADYALLRHFALSTSDAQGITWSPCGRFIAAYDGILNYQLSILSPLGNLLHTFSPSSPSFSLLPSSEDPGLGIRCATWAPGGRWIALGGWDGRVRIVESEGGRCVADLSWAARTVDKETVTWREPSDWLRETRGRGIVQFNKSTGSTPIPVVRADLNRSPPRTGIVQLAFDSEATLFFVRLDTQPHVVHIHTFLPTPTSSSPEISHLAAVVFTEPIRSARWCSSKRKLVICTKGAGIYFWDGDGGWVEDGDDSLEIRGGTMEGVGIPAMTDFVASDAIWSPDGNSVTILDKANAQFCILYDDDGENDKTRETTVAHEGLTHVSEEDEWAEEDQPLGSLVEAKSLWEAAHRPRLGVV